MGNSLILDKLQQAAEAAQGWANVSEAWANSDDFEDEDPGVQMPTWIVGAIDDDGVHYDVAIVDCEQYSIPGDSEKLAKFYAEANPATVLELVRRLREAEKDRDAADDMSKALADLCQQHDRRFEFLHKTNSDAAGYEWGVYRVKWKNGRAVDVLQTNSDLADLDAEVSKFKPAPNPCQEYAQQQEVEEIEQLRKDAERYRLLKRGQHWSTVNGVGDTLRGEGLDRAIDAVLSTQEAKSGD